MKCILCLFVLISLNAFAWNPPIKEEGKLKYATWAGRGVVAEKTFMREIAGDGYLWKATLLVKETLKGDSCERLDFYFLQDEGPRHGAASMTTYYRCPPFPTVEEGKSVRIFLDKQSLDGHDGLFLNGAQMIEGEPAKDS